MQNLPWIRAMKSSANAMSAIAGKLDWRRWTRFCGLMGSSSWCTAFPPRCVDCGEEMFSDDDIEWVRMMLKGDGRKTAKRVTLDAYDFPI